ncbi:hypothetical protein AALO_G00207170 [Alosa alosa]|uniref:Cadherin domain-containing protein n=1 Tax=Alosa alosa TaxID=278164 RepID=A0AAV6G4Y8_9TELE|nr:hypothetical protein AALO_G00207170 [Alosa alosa]
MWRCELKRWPRLDALAVVLTLPPRRRLHAKATLTLEVAEETSGLKVKVHLTLLDENDHAPVFSRQAYHAVVNESVPVGTTVLLLTATDADRGENGYITYSLEVEPAAEPHWPPFSVNQFSGAVLTRRRLDSRQRREFLADVLASVGLGAGALDPDRLTPLKYSIQSGNSARLFSLQPDTGHLLLTRPLPAGHAYSLRITATDGDHASDPMSLNVTTATSVSAPSLSCQDMQVAEQLAEKLSRPRAGGRDYPQGEGLMDLFSANRHAPRFSEDVPEKVWVPEDTPTGASLLQLQVTDDDAGLSGQLLYSVAHGNSDGCLTVGMRSGEVTLFQPLDRERTERYHANISVYDQGSPRRSTWKLITFIVTDVNDNTPRFLQPDGYHTHILENTPVGTEVVQLEAVDADEGLNAAVLYSLLTEAPFGINASSGLVYVAGQLDRETTPSYTLRVEARDSAPERSAQRVAVTTLEVELGDVNDVAPVLIPPRVCVRVREDTPVGALIAWPDTHDPDLGPGGTLTHTLANDYNATFTIHTHTGAIRLNKELDYEMQQVYNVTVRVQDGGVPVSLLTEGWLEVEAPVLSCVVARDDDTGRDGQLLYSLRGGSGLGRFDIDEDTGLIYTTDVLDRETQDSYWLTVYATDMGVVPQSAVLHVYIQVEDVNDNAPLTSDPMYHASVLENSPKDLSIIQIYAQDPDATPTAAQLSFRITSGNARNLFSIDSHTGLITTTSKKLDREQQDEHLLEVTVSDGAPSPQQAVVCVCVSVLDVNDNAPVFLEKVYHVRVPERRRRQATIYRVFAHDRDHSNNAELTYSITDGSRRGSSPWSPTAWCKSRKHFSAGNYDILTIKAVDGGRPQRWTSARLHIEWVGRPAADSAPPVFDERLYNFSVTETDRVGEIVGVVSVKHSSSPLWFEIIGLGPLGGRLLVHG